MSSSMTVVGSINADVSIQVARHPSPGETVLGHDSTISPGGKGANQAVAAALQGASVSFVGAVGNDTYADHALKILRSAGVNLDAVETIDDNTGVAYIQVSDDGENSIIVIPGANAHVTADYVEHHRKPIEDADIVLLQGEIPADGFSAAVQAARGTVVVNLAPVIDVDRDCLLRADPLMANEHEAALILEQLGAPVTSEDPRVLIEALCTQGFASVVLTLGGHGALVADASGVTPIATPYVTAVDTTGAGDAFAGAFVARRLQGDSLIDAATFAARVGAFSVQGRGAQTSYPSESDTLPAV
ncbi:ribokinase [Corynebacterium diphtheriae]|nr:ribokinase [Corynebacterium diphtheriae]CAB0741891.1 ribokinase [Corynebacterium diphtheriae]